MTGKINRFRIGLWSGVLFLLILKANCQATITGTSTDISLTPWTPARNPMAVFKLDLQSDNSGDVFQSVLVQFNDVGVPNLDSTEIASVAIYRDNGDGNFGAGDTVLTNGTVNNPAIGSEVTIDFADEYVNTWTENPPGTWSCTYFIVIMANTSNIEANDDFTLRITRIGWNYTLSSVPNPPDFTGSYTSQTIVWQFPGAGIINPSLAGELTRQDGIYQITWHPPLPSHSTTLYYKDILTPGSRWVSIGTFGPGTTSHEWNTQARDPGVYQIGASFGSPPPALQPGQDPPYISSGTIRVVRVSITAGKMTVQNQGILSKSCRTAVLYFDVTTQTGYGNPDVMNLTSVRCYLTQTSVSSLPNRSIASVALYRDSSDSDPLTAKIFDPSDFSVDYKIAEFTAQWEDDGTTEILFSGFTKLISATYGSRFYIVVRTSGKMEHGDTFQLALGHSEDPAPAMITVNDIDPGVQYPNDWNFGGTALYRQSVGGTTRTDTVTCEQRIVDMTARRSDQGHGIPVGAAQTRWWNDYPSWGNNDSGQGGPYLYSQWTYNWFGASDHAYPYGPEELEVMRLTAPYPVLGLDLAGVALDPLHDGQERLYKLVVTFEDTYPQDFDYGKLASHPMAPHPNIAIYQDTGDGNFDWRTDTCIWATEDSTLRRPPAPGGHIINNWESVVPDVPAWSANTLYRKGDYVKPTTDNGFVYECLQVVGFGAPYPDPLESGYSGNAEPDWPTEIGEKVVDGGVIWVNRGHSRPPRWRVTMYFQNLPLEATCDDNVDYFIAISSAPDHQWVTRTPKYGMNFRAYIEESTDDEHSFIQFCHMSNLDGTPNPAHEDNSKPQLADVGTRSKLYRHFQPSGRNNGDLNALPPVPVADMDGCKEARTVFSIEPWYVASEAPMTSNWQDGITGSTDPVDPDGWPVPILAMNMCDSNYPADGSAYSDSETFEWIRVWFKGTNGFKPTDLAPLSDNAYSGVSLWLDTPAPYGTDTKGLPQIFIPGMHSFTGYGSNPVDTCVRLSADSLQWYNYDGTVWSPENDDPGGLEQDDPNYNPNKPPDAIEPSSGKRYYKSYYVILKPKTAIQLYPDDLWTGQYRGYDYYICVRGRGIQDARYTSNWWERGIDAGDVVTAFIRGNEDIQFGSGLKASIDPVKTVHSAYPTVMPVFFTDLTQAGQTINPQQKTAVIGYNMVAPPGTTCYLSDLRIHILDDGTRNFDITDFISISNVVDAVGECNDPNGGCGIALYKDDGLIPGVFDNLDSRVTMRAVPTLESHPGFTGDPNGPWIVHLWFETNPDNGVVADIPTTDTGDDEGIDYFLVVQPRSTMESGDDISFRHWSDDVLEQGEGIMFTFTGGQRQPYKQIRTNTLTNKTVSTSILANLVTPSQRVDATSDPVGAIGLNVYDAISANTLNRVRVYFNPVGTSPDTHPETILAPLSGNNSSGLSVWADANNNGRFDWRSDRFLPINVAGWRSDFDDGYVDGDGTATAGSGGHAARTEIPAGQELTFFKPSDKVCWYDADGDSVWSSGDGLWVDLDGDRRFTSGTDSVIYQGSLTGNEYGVLLHNNLYGFAYYDEDSDGVWDDGEDIYFLGRGRKVLGYFADLHLSPVVSVPANDNNGLTDFFIAFRTGDKIKFTDQFSLSLPANAVTYSSGYSYANTNLTTNVVTARIPVFLNNLVQAGDRIYKDEYHAVIGINLYDDQLDEDPPGNPIPAHQHYFSEVNLYLTGTNVFGDLAFLSTGASSGVGLWKDNGDGIFDRNTDTFVQPLSISYVGSDRVRIRFADGAAPVPDTDDPEHKNDYFIVLHSSEVLTSGNTITAEIRSSLSVVQGEGLKFSSPAGIPETSEEYRATSSLIGTLISLTVASLYDSPVPPVGTTFYGRDAQVTCSVTSPDTNAPSGTRYVCTGWTGTGSVPATGTGTMVTFTINQNSTITWQWISEYQLTVTAVGSGSVWPSGSAWRQAGEVVIIAATANAGNQFSKWVVDGVDSPVTQPFITITMNQGHTVEAHFVPGNPGDRQLSLSVSPAGSGSVQAEPTSGGVTYPVGFYPDGFTPVTITAVPAAGYVFASWSGGGLDNSNEPVEGSTKNPIVITMNANRSLVARMVPVNRGLTATAYPAVNQGVLPNNGPDSADRGLALFGINIFSEATAPGKWKSFDVTFTDVDLTDSVSFDTDTLNTFFSLAVYRDDSPVDNGWFSALDNNVATTLSAWTSPAPGVYTATCTLTTPEDLPADDTGASAGADYYLALKTTAALPYGLRFAVGVSNFIIATNDVDAPYTPAGTTTTNTIVAEAAINDLVSVTGFDYSIPEEMSEPGKNYLMLADNADLITRYRYQHYLTDDNLDGETANLTKFTSRPMVLPIDTPTALLGIDAAGNAGVQKALATYQELVLNSVTVTFKDTSGGRFDPKTTLTALNAVNPGQSGVAIYADTNNNGIFDAAVDTAVPVDATRGTNGFTWGTDGDDNTTLTIYLDATAANAALPATSDGRSDFFVVVRVSQNNVPYGASFKTFIKQGDISFVQVPQAAKEALSIAESKVAAAPLVFALSDITARYIDPRSSNIPIIGVNLAFGTNSTETLDYIKVTLSGDGLSASDFLPISGGTPPAGAVVPSGLMLYRDNKAAGLVGSFDASDIFVPIHSHSWVYENGKLTGIVQPETAIAVSGNVLANDTGANRGDDYFIILRTSSTLKYQDKIQVSVGATDVSISGHASAAGGLNSDADREKDGSQPIVANVTTLLSDLTRAGQRMNPSGAPTAVMKFTAYSSDETGVETVYLQSVVVHLIPGTGFNLSDLAFFTRDKNSGLALYADSNKNGVFDEEDQLVVPVVAPSSLSRSDEPYYRFLIQPENPPQVSTTGSTFFVVLRASASMEDSDTFQVRIHGSNIEPLRSYGVGYGTKVAADPTSKLYQEAVVASAGPEPEKLTLTAALNDTGNDFTQDWYLLVKSGAAAGKVYRIVSVDHTRTVVTCAGANFVTAGVAGGDQVRVLKVNGFSFAKLSTNVISGNPYFSPLVLTDLIGPNGTGVDATSDPVAAIGISVCDLAANTTLNSLRVYFNPLAPAGSLPTPGQALASISSTRSSGLSLWRDNGDGIFNPATDTLVPVTSSGWQSDSSGYITGQVAPEGSRLSLFAASDKVSWYDQDANGFWSPGDALWVDANGNKRYDNGETLLAGTVTAGTTGIDVSSGEYGFAYRDGNSNGQYDSGEGLYFLGRGRTILGRYIDLNLVSPEPLPTAFSQNGPTYFLVFRTGENLEYKDSFSLSLPSNALVFSAGRSYGDTNLTTGAVTARLPVFLTDLVSTNDTISRSEQKAIIRIHAYDSTSAEANYLREVNVYFTGTNVVSDLAPLGITSDSGVALYRDTGNGVFSSQSDTFVTPTSITWIDATRVRMTFASNADTLIPDNPGTYFFIVVKGNSVATLGDTIRGEIRSICSSPTGEGLKFVTGTGTAHLSGEYLLGNSFSLVGPALSVQPASLDFGFTTETASFTITNTGTGLLNWSLGTAVYQQGNNWVVSASPSNGVLSGGSSTTVTVTVSRNGLSAGNYTAALPVTSNANNTAVTIMMAVASPELLVTPDSLDFDRSLTSLQLNIRNTGGGTLNWNITRTAAWITSISPASGTTTTEVDTVVVEVNRQGLPVGTYNSDITVTAGSQVRTIPVRMVVTPNLTVNPATLNFGTTINTMSFNLANAGTGSVAWLSTVIYQQGADWITSIVPANGTVSDQPVSVSVTVNRTNLVPGLSYSATVRINDDAYTETELVTVTVSVASGPSNFAPGKIAAGQFHSLGIKRNGTLWAWGRNNSGQIGDGTNNDALVPVQIGTDTNWSLVAAGHSHSLAIKTDGTLWAWGANNYGQLGDGTATNRLTPVQIGLDSDWVAVSAGSAHTVALKSDGSLWAWGQNSYGQLGDGTTVTRYSPVRIGTENNWVAVACGWFHTLAMKSDGTIWSWGNNAYGQLGRTSSSTDFYLPRKIGSETNWAKITAGWYHSVAVKSNGLLYAWGANDYGQLGTGGTGPASTPTQVNSDTNWQDVEAGWAHTLAIKKDGTLWAWGNNTYGQLGVSEDVNSETMNKLPNRVGLENTWVSIAAGGQHSLGLRYDGTNGTLWAWGSNAYGQLGDGTRTSKSTPTQVGIATDWRSTKGGGSYAAAVKADGTLWTWGENSAGQLGDGSTVSKSQPVPVLPEKTWSRVSTGTSHSLAIASDGSLWAWGENDCGQLGDGSTASRNQPLLISSQFWQAVSAGRKHSAAIRGDGTLWTWGDNSCGQLGDGSISSHHLPQQVGTANNWKAVSAGGRHTVALKADGTLWAWGDNSCGQLGDGTYLDRPSPVRIGFDTDWLAISAGTSYTIALKTNGTLWAWGSNWYGQLGDGTTVDRPYPVMLSGADWVAISAGEAHSAALKKDGSLWTWGHNGYGRLGDGSSVDRVVPVRVGQETDWVSVSVAESATLAVKANGSLWFWGQLSPRASGDTADKLVPVPVLWNGKADLNGDDTIDILDVMVCLRMALGLEVARPAVADLDEDSAVTILDVIRILRRALSLTDTP